MRPLSALGEVHAPYAPPSSEQTKVAPATPVNEIDAVVALTVPVGAPERLGFAGGVTTVHDAVAALETLPAESV